MRKKYEKPAVIIERFELNQSIAACDWQMTNATDVSICNAENETLGMDFGNIFANSTACTTIAEGYCYQNGSSSINVFSS